MSWQQSKGSPQWSYWRGATRPPWKQTGKGAHQKGQWEEKPAGMQFPAYDSKSVNKTGLLKEVHSTTYVQDPLVSELQRAVNTARRAEGKVRKLETDKVARKQQWETWEQELKRTYVKEKQRYKNAILKIEREAESANEELQEARR